MSMVNLTLAPPQSQCCFYMDERDKRFVRETAYKHPFLATQH